ncbi:MAG: Smr/MutS family protein [Hyphomicrobium sp.]
MKRPAGKGGRKHLDDDDDDAGVWSHTAQSIEPLKRRKSRVHPALDAPCDPAVSPRAAVKSSAPERPAPIKKPTIVRPEPPPAPRKAPPPLAAFDRNENRKIRSGRVEIDARIDLHGMRQDEAHAALVAFLRRCQSKGQRWVLVITGKGKIANSDEHRSFDGAGGRDRGVLRRNVPRWLEEPDLRVVVVSYTPAAIQHGGDGALYVHLRTKRRD